MEMFDPSTLCLWQTWSQIFLTDSGGGRTGFRPIFSKLSGFFFFMWWFNSHIHSFCVNLSFEATKKKKKRIFLPSWSDCDWEGFSFPWFNGNESSGADISRNKCPQVFPGPPPRCSVGFCFCFISRFYSVVDNRKLNKLGSLLCSAILCGSHFHENPGKKNPTRVGSEFSFHIKFAHS